MKQESPLGLAELIEHVKHELLSTETDSDTAPLFSIDTVNLELKVSVSKSAAGNAKVQIKVLQWLDLGEVGGNASFGRDDVHTVRVALTPLLSKDDRIALFKQRHPERWHEIEQASVEATLRDLD